MIRVLDSTATVDPATAKDRGYTAILRYVLGNNPLSKAECETYTAADFGIGSLFELNPLAASLGEGVGAGDAAMTVPAVVALGQPKGTTIWYSCDQDPAGLPGAPVLNHECPLCGPRLPRVRATVDAAILVPYVAAEGGESGRRDNRLAVVVAARLPDARPAGPSTSAGSGGP